MLVTAKQIQKLDKMAIGRLGIPSIVLMENAGRAVADEAIRMLKGKKNVLIICGSGHNGGDGFVAARYLFDKGCQVTVVVIDKPSALKNDAAVNYAILKRLRVPVVRAGARDRPFLQAVEHADIVIDAIFGVGLNRDIEGPVEGIIETINSANKKILAVDTPSGLDVTSGKVLGVCVKADSTVTFTLSKKGFKTGVGPQYTGRLIVAAIGIPKALHKYCR